MYLKLHKPCGIVIVAAVHVDAAVIEIETLERNLRLLADRIPSGE